MRGAPVNIHVTWILGSILFHLIPLYNNINQKEEASEKDDGQRTDKLATQKGCTVCLVSKTQSNLRTYFR